MNEEIYLAIERYLANEMEAEEKSAFETRLMHDNDLNEKLSIYKSSIEALASKYRGEEKEGLFRRNLTKIASEELGDGKGRILKLNWYAWAAAASVALLCVMLFYASISKPDYDAYARYEPLAWVERGSDDGIKQRAQESFNHKEYNMAIKQFDALLQTDPENVEAQLYKGIALLELDRIDEANSIFNSIQNTGSVYKDKAVWMLALSALKQKDYKKCEQILKGIPIGSAAYDDAQELLDDL